MKTFLRFAATGLFVLLVATAVVSAQAPPPLPIQNVPLVNESLLPSALNVSNMASALHHLSVDRASYESESAVQVRNDELNQVPSIKLVHVETVTEEFVQATRSGEGLPVGSDSVSGRLVLRNLAGFPVQANVTASLANAGGVNVSGFSFAGLPEGGAVEAHYRVLTPKQVQLAVQSEWRSLTFEGLIDQRVSEGLLSPEGAALARREKKLVAGVDNRVEFRYVLENPTAEVLEGVRLVNPLPDSAVGVVF